MRISELAQSLSSIEISSMELLDQEVVGVENLRIVATELYGPVKRIDDSLGPHLIGEKVKHNVHRGMRREINKDFEIIYLHFPGIKRDELSLRSDDGQLYVGLNGRERVIDASVSVKASQVDAKLENDVLRLSIPLRQE